MKKETKNIFDCFSEKFPILQKLYELYNYAGRISNYEDNTIRKSTEITVLEIIELIVIATKQDKGNKRQTLKQVERKLDCIKVFFDMAKDLNQKEIDGANECLYELSRMVGGWLKALKDPEFEKEV